MTKTVSHRPQLPWIGNKIQMIALALMMAIGGAVTAALHLPLVPHEPNLRSLFPC